MCPQDLSFDIYDIDTLNFLMFGSAGFASSPASDTQLSLPLFNYNLCRRVAQPLLSTGPNVYSYAQGNDLPTNPTFGSHPFGSLELVDPLASVQSVNNPGPRPASTPSRTWDNMVIRELVPLSPIPRRRNGVSFFDERVSLIFEQKQVNVHTICFAPAVSVEIVRDQEIDRIPSRPALGKSSLALMSSGQMNELLRMFHQSHRFLMRLTRKNITVLISTSRNSDTGRS